MLQEKISGYNEDRVPKQEEEIKEVEKKLKFLN